MFASFKLSILRQAESKRFIPKCGRIIIKMVILYAVQGRIIIAVEYRRYAIIFRNEFTVGCNWTRHRTIAIKIKNMCC